MSKSRTRRKLEKLLGTEEIIFVLPYPFLPPRFQKEARCRNLLLDISPDTEMRLRYEGDRLGPEEDLSPRQVQTILRYMETKIPAYCKDLGILIRFLTAFDKAIAKAVASEEEEEEPDEPPTKVMEA